MDLDMIYGELSYKTSRSGGAGGQHVNKVATKVELLLDVSTSSGLSSAEKELIKHKLGNKIDGEGVLHVVCSETRSQLKNKEIAWKRLILLLKGAVIKPKSRKPTRPKRSAVKKRLENKKKHSLKKESRRFKPKKD